MKTIFKNENGISLVELMTALALLGLVLALGYMFFDFGTTGYARGELRSNVQREIRVTSVFITQQLRFADEVEINPDQMELNYNYIYLENGSIIHRNVAGDLKILIDSTLDGVDYDLRFSKAEDKDFLLQFVIDSPEVDYFHDSKVSVLNIDDEGIIDSNLEAAGLEHGSVIQYKIPGTPVWEYISASKRFWRDFVKNFYEGTLDRVDEDTYAETNIETGELYLNIKGEGRHMGALLFKDAEQYLEQLEGASIENYRVTIDAKSLTPEGGWGILLNGYTYVDGDGVIKDNGYMFQFDPGARGFLLRRIKDGNHPTNISIGAEPGNVDDSYGLRYHATYAPEHISNETFQFSTYVDGSTSTLNNDWFERYNTIIDVKIEGEGSSREMFIEVTLVDENGNKSETMHFGDFGTVQMYNGDTFNGHKLGFDSPWSDWDENGTVVGLRSWDKDQDVHETYFYSIELGATEN